MKTKQESALTIPDTEEVIKLKQTIKRLRKRIAKLRKNEQEEWEAEADEWVALNPVREPKFIEERCPKCGRELEVIDMIGKHLKLCGACLYRKLED